MNLAELAREIAYPVTQPVLLLALVFFWVLLVIALQAGLLGLFLLLIVLPAYVRYLLAVLDARTHGLAPEPPTVEMFSFVDSAWTLFPLLPGAALVWLEYALSTGSGATTGTGMLLHALFLLASALFVPASLAVLTMTHSPIASISPMTLYAVIRRSLPAYLAIPGVMAAVMGMLYGLQQAGVPAWLLDLVKSYQLFLVCSLTGGVMYRSGIQLEVDIPAATETDPVSVDARQSGERQAVANHAYGFISRGNRAGGLKHVQQRIDEEADVDGAWQWFFDEMMRWESSDAVLFFAQNYLSRLLRLDQDAAAIRVLTRCLHRNPRFRPLQQDRQLMTQLLQRYRREDLLQQLAN